MRLRRNDQRETREIKKPMKGFMEVLKYDRSRQLTTDCRHRICQHGKYSAVEQRQPEPRQL